MRRREGIGSDQRIDDEQDHRDDEQDQAQQSSPAHVGDVDGLGRCGHDHHGTHPGPVVPSEGVSLIHHADGERTRFYASVRLHLPASVHATDAQIGVVVAELTGDASHIRPEAWPLLASVVARRLRRAR